MILKQGLCNRIKRMLDVRGPMTFNKLKSYMEVDIEDGLEEHLEKMVELNMLEKEVLNNNQVFTYKLK